MKLILDVNIVDEVWLYFYHFKEIEKKLGVIWVAIFGIAEIYII